MARLHLSQPLWRRIRSSIVMGVQILTGEKPNYATTDAHCRVVLTLPLWGVQVSPGTSAYVPERPFAVIVPVNAWRQSGKHENEKSGLEHDTVTVRLVPLTVPVT